MTTEEKREMHRVFPNGWEENDVPAYIRKREEKELKGAEIEEDEARKTEWEKNRDFQDSALETI